MLSVRGINSSCTQLDAQTHAATGFDCPDIDCSDGANSLTVAFLVPSVHVATNAHSYTQHPDLPRLDHVYKLIVT